MTPLRQQMLAALQLRGKGERTPQAYVREVRLLAQFLGTSPAWISAPELQASCLHRKNGAHLAPASLRICSRGLRFFSLHVLQRDWHTLSRMRAQTAHRLPAMLSVQEVRRLLTAATPLLEAGGNLRLIPRYLGHTRLETTMVSLHLTHTGHEEAYARLNSLMQGLAS